MSQTISASTMRSYGLERVCRVWAIARSTVYRLCRGTEAQVVTGELKKRGPKGACSDTELVRRIRQALEDSPWVGEGYRKVWARLRATGTRTAARRVLRVMRQHGLLAPSRSGHPHGPKAHDGTIIPERPDQRWGTDQTTTLTGEGNAAIFILVDHCTAECLGIHAARNGTRFEALEPTRQAVWESFGSFEPQVAQGTELRHDHGSPFVSHVFQQEIALLGLESSPSYVREPEDNGCAERFIRTLKEQLLWLRRFETVEQLRLALLEFKDRYNNEWLIERHGWISPAEQRRRLTGIQAAA